MESSNTNNAYKSGDRVLHPKFGKGTVTDTAKAEVRGESDRVQVRFDSTVSKWLVLEYARLVMLNENDEVASQKNGSEPWSRPETEPEPSCEPEEATLENLRKVICRWEASVGYIESGLDNDSVEYTYDLSFREELHGILNGVAIQGMAVPDALKARIDAADKRFIELTFEIERHVWGSTAIYDKTIFWYYYRWPIKHPAMIEQVNQYLTVEFGDCDAGWILMRLTAGERSLTVRMSHFLDPLPDMLAWLEAIAIGVPECGFRVDEEGAFVSFTASRQLCASDKSRVCTILDVVPEYDVKPLQATLPTNELVGIFYRAFREFADSTAYVREQWEYITLEQMLHEQFGMTTDAWIDSVIALEPRQLQKALWRLEPVVMVNPPDYLDFIGTEAELIELTGKTRAEAGGLPQYCPLPDELWVRCTDGDKQARREYLEECLSEPARSWRGTPWRRMRSSLIEKWLSSETTAPYEHWKKWLT